MRRGLAALLLYLCKRLAEHPAPAEAAPASAEAVVYDVPDPPFEPGLELAVHSHFDGASAVPGPRSDLPRAAGLQDVGVDDLRLDHARRRPVVAVPLPEAPNHECPLGHLGERVPRFVNLEVL